MPCTSADPRTAAVVQAYENLQRSSLPALMERYAESARFQDPFNDVQGRPAIERIFVHMFDALTEPHFDVHAAVTEGPTAFLTWTFHFRRSASAPPMCIHGATQLAFDGHGLVVLHRDYWDAAQELYAQLPILGALVRWLRRRFTTPQAG